MTEHRRRFFEKNVPRSAVDRLDPREEAGGERDDVCFIYLYNAFVVDLLAEDLAQDIADHIGFQAPCAHAVDQALQRHVVAYIHGVRRPDACFGVRDRSHVVHVFGGERDGSRGFDV